MANTNTTSPEAQEHIPPIKTDEEEGQREPPISPTIIVATAPAPLTRSSTNTSPDTEGKFNLEELLKRVKTLEETLEDPSVEDNFFSFDIQTWFIYKANEAKEKILVPPFYCALLMICFIVKAGLFVLIGMGTLCSDIVTGPAKQNTERTLSINDESLDSRMRIIIAFSLIIVSLRLVSGIVRDSDMAATGQKCIEAMLEDQECKGFRRFSFKFMQSVTIARRIYMPLLVTITAVHTMRHIDERKADIFGNMFTNPSELLLNTLAILFVLEIDEKICAFCVSPKHQRKTKENLTKLLQEYTEGSLFPGDYSIWGLDLFNRLTATTCIGLLLAGYYSGSYNSDDRDSSWIFNEYTGKIDPSYGGEVHGIIGTIGNDMKDGAMSKSKSGDCGIYWGSAWVLGIIVLPFFFLLAVILRRRACGCDCSESVAHFCTVLSGFSFGLCIIFAAMWLAIGEEDIYAEMTGVLVFFVISVLSAAVASSSSQRAREEATNDDSWAGFAICVIFVAVCLVAWSWFLFA